jgi:hypothetical protein
MLKSERLVEEPYRAGYEDGYFDAMTTLLRYAATLHRQTRSPQQWGAVTNPEEETEAERATRTMLTALDSEVLLRVTDIQEFFAQATTSPEEWLEAHLILRLTSPSLPTRTEQQELRERIQAIQSSLPL